MLRKERIPPDPRHAAIKAVLTKYWAKEMGEPDLPWGAADAGALSQYLKANPQRSVEEITQLLRNRLKSDDHAPGEPVFMWIKYLNRYTVPLNKYKQPKGTAHGTAKPNRADEKLDHVTGSTSAAIDRIQGLDRD